MGNLWWEGHVWESTEWSWALEEQNNKGNQVGEFKSYMPAHTTMGRFVPSVLPKVCLKLIKN